MVLNLFELTAYKFWYKNWQYTLVKKETKVMKIWLFLHTLFDTLRFGGTPRKIWQHTCRAVFLNRRDASQYRDLKTFLPGLVTFSKLWNLRDLSRIIYQILNLTRKDEVILPEFNRYFYIFEETREKIKNSGTKTHKKVLPGLEFEFSLPTGTWSPKGWETLV